MIAMPTQTSWLWLTYEPHRTSDFQRLEALTDRRQPDGVTMRRLSLLLFLFCCRPRRPHHATGDRSRPSVTITAACTAATLPAGRLRRSHPPARHHPRRLTRTGLTSNRAALAVSLKQANDQLHSPRLPTSSKARTCSLMPAYVSSARSGSASSLPPRTTFSPTVQRHPPTNSPAFPALLPRSITRSRPLLHLSDPVSAKAAAETMLRTVPYDDLVSEATGLRRSIPPVQPAPKTRRSRSSPSASPSAGLLKEQAAPPPPSRPLAFSAKSAHPPLPVHFLYADAIALPAHAAVRQAAECRRGLLCRTRSGAPSQPSARRCHPHRRKPPPVSSARLAAPASCPFRLAAFSPFRRCPMTSTPSSAPPPCFFLFPDWCGCVGMGSSLRPPPRDFRRRGFVSMRSWRKPTRRLHPRDQQPRQSGLRLLELAVARATDPIQPIRKPTAAEYLTAHPPSSFLTQPSTRLSQQTFRSSL